MSTKTPPASSSSSASSAASSSSSSVLAETIGTDQHEDSNTATPSSSPSVLPILKVPPSSSSTGEATASTARQEEGEGDDDDDDDAHPNGDYQYWGIGSSGSSISVQELPPLLKYTTLQGQNNTNSNSNSNTCTCSALAQVLVQPSSSSAAAVAAAAAENTTDSSSSSHNRSAISQGSGGGPSSSSSMAQHDNTQEEEEDDADDLMPNVAALLNSDLWKQPHLILAQGWQQTGTVSLMSVQNKGMPVKLLLQSSSSASASALEHGGDAAAGGGTIPSTTFTSTAAAAAFSNSSNALMSMNHLSIRESSSSSSSSSSPPFATVDVSMDSTGTLVAAIDQGGMCCIWELKYTPSWQKIMMLTRTPQQQQQEQQQQDVLPPTVAAAASSNTTTTAPTPASTSSSLSTKTKTTTTSSPTPSTQHKQGGGGMFSSFMTALTGLPPSPEEETSSSHGPTAPPPPSSSTTTSTPLDATQASAATLPTTTTSNTTNSTSISVPCLAASVVSTSRLSYPSHWKPPTCLVLDPAHKKTSSSTKSFLVGFQDGRLVWTKRGGLFQRRNDTVLYQGGATNSSSSSSNTTTADSSSGIECVTWRGSLVAWADASGMKILDIDTLTRIAHIDRPTGARAALYPSLLNNNIHNNSCFRLKPHLQFETADKLLVAWGDCLMNMDIRETALTPGDGTSIAIKRTVQCTMAWELDCVAAGVVPLDQDHVVVLGIVVPNDEEDDDDDEEEEEQLQQQQQETEDGHGNESALPAATVATVSSPRKNNMSVNELEVQIISRHDGTIQYADVLPPSSVNTWLHSSFALPRMDNVSEWNEYKAWSGQQDETALTAAFDMALLTGGGGGGGVDETAPATHRETTTTTTATPSSPNRQRITSTTTTTHTLRPRNTFVDSHLQWNLKSVTFGDNGDNDFKKDPQQQQQQHGDEEEDGESSVDSDDYGFVMRPLELLDDTTDSFEFGASPPTMILVSPSDVIKATLSNVDDAVEHALVAQNRPALALKRALQHRRQLRRYQVSDLVEKYLEALLYLSTSEQQSAEVEYLSFRRMKLAIQAMPVLLGGQVGLWTKWAKELEKLPGALFLLRSHLPVRDPILPPKLYEQVLLGMLKEYERLSTAQDEQEAETSRTAIALDKEAANHVLESLLAWGPTKGLKEYIKLLQYSRNHGDRSVMDSLKKAEIALQRRYLQTSAGYLNFPASQISPENQVLNHTSPRYDAHKDDSQDSLFPLDDIMKWVAPRVPLIAEGVGESSSSDEVPNDRVCLETMARLRMMECRYDLAFQAYLAIGASHSPLSMEDLELRATLAVQNGSSKTDQSVRIDVTSYEFVLGLVENHHLHRLLLEPEFIVKTKPGDPKKYGPLFALFRLVGLTRAGHFLMEHCVSPEIATYTAPGLYSSMDDSKESQRSETLPMDLVAAQLKSSPALQYWYLHLVFTKKPELYVKFPNNAIPPDAVTELHRKHFQLCLEFAGEAKDSAKALSGTETYKVESVTTPLLSFLKAALPLGGISPIDARRQLEILRSEESTGSDDDDDDDGGNGTSPSFALELAYVIEHYNDQSEDEAMAILDLFLEGAKSIMLAVAYAQRQRKYSSRLWDKLINHCLSPNKTTLGGVSGEGILFGSLLEAAALSGADLARLVASIPPGMVVEGLRPRLVSAVADYRLKVDIHQAASAAASEEQIVLLREVAHRSRRGARFMFLQTNQTKADSVSAETKEGDAMDQPMTLPKNLRPIERRDRHNLSLSLPLR